VEVHLEPEFEDVYGGDGGGDVDFALDRVSWAILLRCKVERNAYLFPVNAPVQPRLAGKGRAAT